MRFSNFLLAMFLLEIALILAKEYVDCPSKDLRYLKQLIFVSRHGVRNPTKHIYIADVFNFSSGDGQLTNTGRRQMYYKGSFLRNRYSDIVGNNPRTIYSRSSDLDRTLDSATTFLASFYPPKGDFLWYPSFNWQPVPVHSRSPEEDGALLLPNIHDNVTLQPLLGTTKGQEILKFLKNLLSPIGGVLTPLQINIITSGVLANVANHREYLIPQQILKHYPAFVKFKDIFYASLVNNQTLARTLGIGLYNLVMDNLKTGANSSSRLTINKFYYSTSDTYMSCLLQLLGVYNGLQIPFGATLLIELYPSNLIRLLYMNSTNYDSTPEQPNVLVVPNCTEFCPFETFMVLTSRNIHK